MPYTPPLGNVVIFDFTDAYVAPVGSNVILNFGEVDPDNAITSQAPIPLQFEGFIPSITNIPEANNLVSGAPLLLQFQGFEPEVLNKPGLQVGQFSFYRVGRSSASDLQVEQYGAYLAESASEGTLQVEQFGVYVLGLRTSFLYVNAFSFYLAASYISPLQTDQFGAYISRSEISPLQCAQFGAYIVGRIVPLVIPALASAVPETPIGETWAWASDLIVSDDGSEQRISLRSDPRRSFGNTYIFDGLAELIEIKRQLRALFREEVAIPLYQYATRLKAAAPGGSGYLTFNPVRTDLRNDGWVLIVEDTHFELRRVDNIDGTGCSITVVTDNAFTTKAKVMPVAVGLMEDGASLVQYPKNGAAKLNCKSLETQTLTPFLSPLVDVEFVTLNDLPILEHRAIANEFNDNYDLGREILDYGGKIEFRVGWNYTRLGGEREYICQRYLDQDDWDFWRAFFDYCKGSVNPFYVPTYRDDFEILDPPDYLVDTFTVAGHTYTDAYFDDPTYKQVAIFSEGGAVHYATIATAVQVGDDDELTLSPGLPDGEDWEDATISLLLLCRLGTDEVNLMHQGLETKFSTSIRTVDA